MLYICNKYHIQWKHLFEETRKISKLRKSLDRRWIFVEKWHLKIDPIILWLSRIHKYIHIDYVNISLKKVGHSFCIDSQKSVQMSNHEPNLDNACHAWRDLIWPSSQSFCRCLYTFVDFGHNLPGFKTKTKSTREYVLAGTMVVTEHGTWPNGSNAI